MLHALTEKLNIAEILFLNRGDKEYCTYLTKYLSNYFSESRCSSSRSLRGRRSPSDPSTHGSSRHRPDSSDERLRHRKRSRGSERRLHARDREHHSGQARSVPEKHGRTDGHHSQVERRRKVHRGKNNARRNDSSTGLKIIFLEDFI